MNTNATAQMVTSGGAGCGKQQPKPMKTTNQIAAEATDKLDQQQLLLPFSKFQTYEETKAKVQSIIKDAIEKATENAVRETSDYIMAKLRQEPRAAHASEPVCTCNKENRGGSQHSSHCLAVNSATKAPTSVTKVQLKPAHASEEWTGDFVANTFNINAWDVCDKIADAHNLAIDLSRAAHASGQVPTDLNDESDQA